MALLDRLRNLFSHKKQDDLVTVDAVEIGQLVEVTFFDPRTLGIQVPGQLTCTRFNPDEFEDRKVKGFVKHKGDHSAIPFGKTLTIETRRLEREREFLFLDYEIESMRIID